VPHERARALFPLPPHRTGRADLPHPALRRASPAGPRAPQRPSPAGTALSATSEPLAGLVDPYGQSPGSCCFHCVPEVRSLPSTAVTPLPGYYEPVRLPRRPGLSLAGVRLGHAPTAGDLPCCVRSPCTGMPSSLPRWDRSAGSIRSPDGYDGGLPRGLAGSAPTFCFSRPARRSRALQPACSRGRLATLSIEGFGDFVTSTAAPIATGWSESCRVGLAPTEDRRLVTAHQTNCKPMCKPTW
jgi:hypothetical protein